MTDLQQQPQHNTSADAADPLAKLHKMSTTAGLGTTDYVAINPLAVTTLFLGLGSALAVIDNILLAIPAAAILCGIVAVLQIRKSAGTQTGMLLTIIGLVLSIGAAGYVGARQFAESSATRADEDQIYRLIDQLGNDVKEGKLDHAYTLFSDRFRTRVKMQRFTDLWNMFRQNRYGGLKAMQSNRRLIFETNPSTGEVFASGVVLIEYSLPTPEDRRDVVFSKKGDGSWCVETFPTLFPAEAPGAGK